MLYSAQRVRNKVRAAVKRREESIEQDEMESGELNLIPYLDMVTNLMLFLLASVSAGLILVQIDTTLPDKKPPSPTPVTQPSTNPDDQPLKLFVSIKRDEMLLWSATGLEGTLQTPHLSLKRTGKDGDSCDGSYMCESNACDANTQRCVQGKDEPQAVFDYRALNKSLIEIATRRYAGKQRKADTYQIILQADGAVPYSTVVSTMAAMRCTLPDFGKERCELKRPGDTSEPTPKGCEPIACALPTEDPNLKKAKEPISPDGKLYDTARATYDPKKMALFPEIQFSSGFE